jgi:hypothetical protein
MKYLVLLFLNVLCLSGCRKSEYPSFYEQGFAMEGKWRWVYSRVGVPFNADLSISQDTTLTPFQTGIEATIEFSDDSHGHVFGTFSLNGVIVKLYDFVQSHNYDTSKEGYYVNERVLYAKDTSIYSTVCQNSYILFNVSFFQLDFPFKWTEDFHVYNFYEKIEE